MKTILSIALVAVLYSCNEDPRPVKKTDYQFDLTNDTIYLYFEDQLVAVMPSQSTCELDSFLIDHNQ
jgi:hypothetical protein